MNGIPTIYYGDHGHPKHANQTILRISCNILLLATGLLAPTGYISIFTKKIEWANNNRSRANFLPTSSLHTGQKSPYR